jgi:hypothetical protein
MDDDARNHDENFFGVRLGGIVLLPWSVIIQKVPSGGVYYI